MTKLIREDAQVRLRKARERLDTAIAANERARRTFNREKTPEADRAWKAALSELNLAARGMSELLRKEYGL